VSESADQLIDVGSWWDEGRGGILDTALSLVSRTATLSGRRDKKDSPPSYLKASHFLSFLSAP
jgi:hypothetical protein